MQLFNVQLLKHLVTYNSSLHLLNLQQNWEKVSEIIKHRSTSSWHLYLTEFPIHSTNAVGELHALIKIINYVHPIICLFRHVCCFLTIPNTATTPDNFMNNISPKRYSKCNDAKILPITTYLYQIFITPFSYLVIWFCLFCTTYLKMCHFFLYHRERSSAKVENMKLLSSLESLVQKGTNICTF